jgi:hypothetical protein
MGMKRYLLFSFDHYYPSGGWYDFDSSSDSYQELVDKAKELNQEYWHIVDTETGDVTWKCQFRSWSQAPLTNTP